MDGVGTSDCCARGSGGAGTGGGGGGRDLMSPVWQGLIQNLGIPLEVKGRGGEGGWKDVASRNSNGIRSSKHISVSNPARPRFSNLLPEGKMEWNQDSLVFLTEQRETVGWKEKFQRESCLQDRQPDL